MVEKDEGQYDDANTEVFWATGACLMVRARDFWSEGGLDERFFAHMEEIDLCWRLQLSGKRICVVPKSVVWHLGGGTLPKESPWKLRLNFRNNLLMLGKNLAKTYALGIEGRSPLKAANEACRKARRTIFTRMLLDGCSATVYLLSGKLDFFKAVLSAHHEYKSMRENPKASDVAQWLASHDRRGTAVHGVYDGWIVPRAIFRKKRIFATVRKLAKQ